MSELEGGGCSAKSPFALQVLGDSMEPEFRDGAVIIVDPNVPEFDGAYVVCDHNGETTLRQFTIRGGRRMLVALNERYPAEEINQSYLLRGVVTQQARNRRLGLKRAKHYEPQPPASATVTLNARSLI
ncbi:MAG: S24 family peptidase [Gammaproteobacteria bacterium]